MPPATTTAIAPDLLKALEDNFDLVNRDEIIHFIQDHPALAPLVLEARRVLRGVFDPGSDLALEVLVDPDDDALDDCHLYLLIRTPLSSSDALARLDQFDKEWWLEHLNRANGDLTISIEHI
jgi:hypothetical protein